MGEAPLYPPWDGCDDSPAAESRPVGGVNRRPSRTGVQGYLAQKKTPAPYDRHRVLGIVLLQSPTGIRILIGQVPLYPP